MRFFTGNGPLSSLSQSRTLVLSTSWHVFTLVQDQRNSFLRKPLHHLQLALLGANLGQCAYMLELVLS